MPRPPPHLARRGHGLALAPRPPRRGLPARPLRPDAAAGGESTQSLTLSLGNGCRKVPAAAISPSSRGVPGVLLRPATAPGELWGRPRSARTPAARPRWDSASPTWPPPQPRHHPPSPSAAPSPSATRPDRPSLWTDRRRTRGSDAPAPPSPLHQPLRKLRPPPHPHGRVPSRGPAHWEGPDGAASGLAARPPHGFVAGPSPSSAGHPAAPRSKGAFNARPAQRRTG